MIFNTWTFAVFAVVFAGAVATVPFGYRRQLLVVAGLVFYAFSVPAYLGLLCALAALTYAALRALAAPLRNERQRRGIFLAACAAVVLVLVTFKYSRLLETTVDEVARYDIVPVPHLLVPLAISFYTFEFVHVLVDAYRRTLGPTDVLSFAAFTFFFPTLVAGPIKRYQTFAPQLRKRRPPLWHDIVLNGYRVAIGLFKKIVIADSCSLFTAPLLSPDPPLGGVDYAVALFAYMLKIYFDFSGYSDIAIGAAGLLGIAIPENFDLPLRSRNITEFWNRWHMSLSRWIRDYVFIPLGGSRRPAPIVALNLLLAMAISGLWHGASWNFLLWGLWHGSGLCIHRAWSRAVVPRVAVLRRGGRVVSLASLAGTHGFLMCGWILFATPTFSDAALVVRGLFGRAG